MKADDILISSEKNTYSYNMFITIVVISAKASAFSVLFYMLLHLPVLLSLPDIWSGECFHNVLPTGGGDLLFLILGNNQETALFLLISTA